jgi:hypothetical protein
MKAPVNDQRKAAVLIGKICLRAQLAAESPGVAADKLKAQLTEEWSANRKTYVGLGNTIIRRLERAGFALTPVPGSAPRAPAKGKA